MLEFACPCPTRSRGGLWGPPSALSFGCYAKGGLLRRENKCAKGVHRPRNTAFGSRRTPGSSAFLTEFLYAIFLVAFFFDFAVLAMGEMSKCQLPTPRECLWWAPLVDAHQEDAKFHFFPRPDSKRGRELRVGSLPLCCPKFHVLCSLQASSYTR